MAAFLIFPNSVHLNKEAIVQHFQEIGILNYSEHKLGDYSLLLFQKIKINELNYIRNDAGLLASVGSFVYKGLNYRNGLSELFKDLENNCYDANQIYGIYTLIYHDSRNDKTTVISDPALFKSLYVDFRTKILSSHWMPIIRVQPNKYPLNTSALLESVITGSLIAPDTYAVGIERVCQSNFKELQTHFPEMNFRRELPLIENNVKTSEEGISLTNQLLQDYFRDCNKLSEQYGAHVGLTGGFDSRLLMVHAHQNLSKVSANSFYRPNSKEYDIAKKIAKQLKLDFCTHEGLNYKEKDLTDEEKTFLYLDGQIRSQNYINEPFSNPSYFDSLYNNYFVGFHGCGGEQYRNAERFPKRLSLKSYIRTEWLKKDTLNLLQNQEIKDKVFNRVYDKIQNEIGLQDDIFSLYDIKRFQNEIWNPANRLTRANALNQSMFYFAPFTEYILSQSAYKLIPFLGIGNNYQVKILQATRSEVNAIETVHGYSINKGISKKESILNNVFSIIPRSFGIRLFNIIKQRRKKKTTNNNFLFEDNNPLKFLFDQKKTIYSKEVQNNIIASNYLFKLLEFKDYERD